MRKRLTTILRRIANWRKERTGDADKKIIGGWHEYTLTADGLRKGCRCFNCHKRSNGIDYLMPVGNATELLYFCSDECEKELKALLREV